MRALPALCAAVLLASPAYAQHLRGPDRGAFSLGGGTELLTVRADAKWNASLSLQGSYWLPQQTDRLRFRLTGTYLHSTDDLGPGRVNTLEAIGASVETAAFLGRSGQGLYGIAGVGVFRLQLDMPNTGVGFIANRRTTGTLIGGVGYLTQLGPFTGFAEVRIARFSNGAGIAWGQMPLTFGIRF